MIGTSISETLAVAFGGMIVGAVFTIVALSLLMTVAGRLRKTRAGITNDLIAAVFEGLKRGRADR